MVVLGNRARVSCVKLLILDPFSLLEPTAATSEDPVISTLGLGSLTPLWFSTVFMSNFMNVRFFNDGNYFFVFMLHLVYSKTV